MTAGAAPDGDGDRYSVLGVWVHAVDRAQALRTIEGWIATGRRSYVCHANVHGVMEARKDPALRQAYNEAGLTVADGMPLVWLGRLRRRARGRCVGRVYGPDLMLDLAAAAARGGRACYFYGGRPGVPEALAESFPRRFPGLRAVGACAPPFRALTPAEDEAAVRAINAARPDVVWVGLGCPKQERWMAAHRARLDAPVLLGVGAAFDFHTGRVAQAPRWMRAAGLEWLFRLGREPRRLGRRYLVYNPLFLAHAALQLAGLRRYPPLAPPGGAHALPDAGRPGSR